MTDRRIVISTMAQDEHAMAVDAALRALGADPIFISHSSAPERGDLSIGGDWSDPDIRVGADHFRPSVVSSFWSRRSARLFNLSEQINPLDRAHIESGFQSVFLGLSNLLDHGFAVNPLSAVRCTSNKLNQLRIAAQVGMPIPRTLVSNDPAEVEDFRRLAEHVCMKPMAAYVWRNAGQVRMTLTRILPAGPLNPRAVAIMPQIFQESIQKSYEVRLTMFGRFSVATRIGLSDDPADQQDWRGDKSYTERLEPIAAPEFVRERCRAMMRLMGLRFGSFDFVIRPDGEWVFLEVNEAGQFLWQEAYVPNSSLLEPFARYLIAATDDFSWDATRKSPSLSYASISAEVASSPRYEGLRIEAFPESDLFVSKEGSRQPDCDIAQ